MQRRLWTSCGISCGSIGRGRSVHATRSRGVPEEARPSMLGAELLGESMSALHGHARVRD